MRKMNERDMKCWERLLSRELAAFATDLRLLEAIDLFKPIQEGRLSHIRSLVQSSAELHFAANALVFSDLGEARLSWRSPPQIILGLEFHWAGVHVFFRLVLEAHYAAIDIDYVHFDADDAESTSTERVAAAIEAARMARRGDGCEAML